MVVFNLVLLIGGLATTVLAINATTSVDGDPITGC